VPEAMIEGASSPSVVKQEPVENTGIPDVGPPPEVAPAPTATRSPVTWDEIKASLPEEYREASSLKGVKSFEDYVKWGDNATKLVRSKGIILPDESDPTDIERFRKEIGVPESPDAYDLGDFAPPEGMPWDDDLQSRMLARFHADGITGTLAPKLIAAFAEEQKASFELLQRQEEAKRVETIQELQRELGTQYAPRLAMANRLIDEFSGDDIDTIREMRLADGSPMRQHPAIVKLFMNAGMGLGEGDEEHGFDRKERRPLGRTPDEAKKELSILYADKEKETALFDKSHPLHDEMVREHTRLNMEIHGEGDEDPHPVLDERTKW
jgi:hypothetical protein